MKLIEHFVGGKLFSGSSDRKGKVFNPATGEQESGVKLASKSDLNQVDKEISIYFQLPVLK